MTVSLDDQIKCVKREIEERMKPPITIPLRPGLELIVDERDLWLFGYFRWTVCKGHNTHYLRRGNGEAFHRSVLGVERGVIVDHRNGNGLDNRRGNLRIATRVQNNWNRPRRDEKFNGVSFHPFSGLWRARIWTTAANGMRKETVTYHKTEELAARAWDEMALAVRGEWAHLNFPTGPSEWEMEIAAMQAVLATLEAKAAEGRLI